MADRRNLKIVYTGVSLEGDLRAWLDRLASDLEEALAAAPRPASSTDKTWHVSVARDRARDAVDVIRRASRMKALAPLFPERLNHAPASGRRFWMVVDAIDAGKDQRAEVARRWAVERATVDRALRDLGDTVRYAFRFPLDDDLRAEVRALPRLFPVRRTVRR